MVTAVMSITVRLYLIAMSVNVSIHMPEAMLFIVCTTEAKLSRNASHVRHAAPSSIVPIVLEYITEQVLRPVAQKDGLKHLGWTFLAR